MDEAQVRTFMFLLNCFSFTNITWAFALKKRGWKYWEVAAMVCGFAEMDIICTILLSLLCEHLGIVRILV